MEKLGEQGDFVHDCASEATGGWCVCELPDPIGAGKVVEDVGDAGVGVGILIGIHVPDTLESWPEFMATVFNSGEANAGQEDKSELGGIDGNAVGLHSPSL